MPDAAPTAIVTGAASGIGRALARRLADHGYRLVLVDRDAAGLDALGAELTSDHELVVADVADAAAWRGLADTLRHDGADIALLVQAAGALLAGRLVDCPPDDIERLVRVNLTGVLHGAAAIGPLLAASAAAGVRPPLPRGVLNVASIFAAVAPPGFAVYNATKAGVVAATETLRGEWAPLGLTATAVLPGVTRTGLFAAAAYADERFRESVHARVDAAELTAERVADASLQAYRRRRAVAAVGGRAGRYHWLKRLAPGALLARVAAQARRELPP